MSGPAASSIASRLAVCISRAEIPVFGSVDIAVQWSKQVIVKRLPKLAPWTGPLAAGGLWFVWPAVKDETKISMGIMKGPEA